MSKFIFSGVITEVQVFGSKSVKLIKYKVDTVRKRRNEETKKEEQITEVFYVRHWAKKLEALQVGFSGHFVGQIDYKRITSKKAVLVGGDEPFVYGGFDFTLNYYLQDFEALKMWVDANYKGWSSLTKVHTDEDYDTE